MRPLARDQQMSTAELAEQARHAGVTDADRMDRDELMHAMQARPGRYGGGPPQKARSSGGQQDPATRGGRPGNQR
ncbi:hypothetical protein [Polymorphospora sp. NPDC050346]|uniref:hypothetical protein n=1 Tax=Polymorphospora sp. NPDC050346 TaxID=3155780 RepID=UPI0034115B46